MEPVLPDFLRVRLVLALTGVLVIAPAVFAETVPLPGDPDFKAVLDLAGVSSPRISPDGSAIAYLVNDQDWQANRYDSEIWLARVGEEPFQLTRTAEKSSNDPQWSPDGQWIAFLADRGEGSQIHVIRAAGGEARPLTAVEDGVASFEWSPDGEWMAVAITDPVADRRQKIEKAYGDFAIEDNEHRMRHLWLLDVAAALEIDEGAELPPEKDAAAKDGDDSGESEDEAGDGGDEEEPPAFRLLTAGSDFTVRGYRWSPDGKRIAFAHTPDPRVESFSDSDISVLDVASGTIRAVVERPGRDADPHWSPDGEWLLFTTKNLELAYHFNDELAKVPVAGGDPVVLTEDFDENPAIVAWLEDGIRFLAFDGVQRSLYRLGADGGQAERLDLGPERVWGVDVAQDGRTLAIDGGGSEMLDEIWRLAPGATRAEQVTRMTDATADWEVGSRELIRWPSRDGASIEGVLLKPESFDPEAAHPLLVIIHGGPAWLSFPERVYGYVYPVQQWLAKGAVILMPNYRGSAGYGEDFRALNVRNLGVGDAWDVLSGVDHLIEQGWVDTERIGAMGWSQGGYISAFLTTSSDRFQAISVGAGISNWMTYYVNTDIHPFTRHYLEATPWDDPEIYAKTSPMTYVKQATTPTLIQHGEFDRRVPTPNAYELFQGLQDVGVDTRLIIYKGFGHGISKPKERLAAVWHNWQWFARHLWGEDVEIELEGEDR